MRNYAPAGAGLTRREREPARRGKGDGGKANIILDAWAVICAFSWLLRAHRNARKGKRLRPEVMAFSERLESNLFLIQAGMERGTWELGPYRKKWVYVPKKRLVMALPYPDRIVQWAIYQYLNPIFDKLFIEDSYACRKTNY